MVAAWRLRKAASAPPPSAVLFSAVPQWVGRLSSKIQRSMRRFLVRGGIAVVLLVVLWFFTSRWCALLVDQF
jgi:hypothetical protein